MPKVQSAGLLVYRRRDRGAQFLLAHPGGPFWRARDDGAWSIPKGLIDEGEAHVDAALREFEEEVGQPILGDLVPLAPCRLKSGKVVHAWLVEADLDLSDFRSNTFEVEWPKGSGRRVAFPEIDRVAYFAPGQALRKIHPAQRPLVLEATDLLGVAAADY